MFRLNLLCVFVRSESCVRRRSFRPRWKRYLLETAVQRDTHDVIHIYYLWILLDLLPLTIDSSGAVNCTPFLDTQQIQRNTQCVCMFWPSFAIHTYFLRRNSCCLLISFAVRNWISSAYKSFMWKNMWWNAFLATWTYTRMFDSAVHVLACKLSNSKKTDEKFFFLKKAQPQCSFQTSIR